MFGGRKGSSVRQVLKYLELKSGYSGNGPAWIARVGLSKSGRTVYFNGKALKRGHDIAGNHLDLAAREEYWVSSVKKDGTDRHWAGSGRISIEAGAVVEYLRIIGASELDTSKFDVIPDFEPTAVARLHTLENMRSTDNKESA